MRPTAVLTVVVLVLLGVSSVAPAEASSKGCVSASEFGRIHHGMTLARVHEIFGSTGRQLFRNGTTVGNTAREYRSCAAFAAHGKRVQVQYNNYRWHGGPMRVAYKQTY